MVQFENATYTVSEEDWSLSICVDSGVTGGFETELVVSLMAMDGKAGECFTHFKWLLSFCNISSLSCAGRHRTLES